MDYELTDNKEAGQYEMYVEGHLARIQYVRNGNTITLTHTEVPGELGGKGIGSTLAKLALEEIRERGLLLVAQCPFVAAYIKRHPEWRSILAKGRLSND